MKRVLGLDASSTTIGLCLVKYDEAHVELEHVEYYKPPKKGNIFERLQKVRAYISDKVEELNPDDVALEDIILFMSGNSTAKTITTLAVLNRTVGLAIADATGKPPYLYNVMAIRHKIKQDKKLPKKEEIPELVAKILDIEFPYKYNRKEKIAKENEDMADAIAVALCHVYVKRASK